MARKVRTVALNALFLSPGESGGPETYLRKLATALTREYPALHLIVLTTRSGERALREDGFGDSMELVALPAEEHSRSRRQFAEQVLAPALAHRRGADVLHNLASTGPAWTPGLRTVLTLHDVTFLKVQTFGKLTTWGMRHVVSAAARDADALITATSAARDDICAALGLDPHAFSVVAHGIEPPAPRPNASKAAVCARLGLEGRRIVLCVAALRPHKNQELLVRTARELPEDVAIVLAGHQEPYAETVRALVRELGVSDRVHLTGYLPHEDLEGLWAGAACAVLPTRSEGFGLPVLEAMARGVPVACADIPVLREVGGDLPLYFDPDDPRAAARAIARAASGASESVDRGRAGIARSADFSWSASARGTMAAYQRALSAPPR